MIVARQVVEGWLQQLHLHRGGTRTIHACVWIVAKKERSWEGGVDVDVDGWRFGEMVITAD